MKQQRGVALIAAIFVIVIIGSALVILSSLVVRTGEQTTQNLLQIRARLAADAGIEAIIQQLVEDSDSSACSDTATITNDISVPAYSTFTVTVNCRFYRYNFNAQALRIYQLEASAQHSEPALTDYIWAQVTASLEM